MKKLEFLVIACTIGLSSIVIVDACKKGSIAPASKMKVSDGAPIMPGGLVAGYACSGPSTIQETLTENGYSQVVDNPLSVSVRGIGDTTVATVAIETVEIGRQWQDEVPSVTVVNPDARGYRYPISSGENRQWRVHVTGLISGQIDVCFTQGTR